MEATRKRASSLILVTAAARYDFNLRMMRWFDHFLKRGAEELPPWRIDYGLGSEVE